MTGLKVTLDPGEAATAVQVAAMRNAVNARAGARTRRDDGTMGARVNLDICGFLAEMAWGKRYNLCPDMTLRVGGVPTPDFTMPDGTTVDIKATWNEDGNLIANVDAGQGHNAQIYVLAIVRPVGVTYEVEFVGWAKHEDFIRPDRIEQLRVPTYRIKRDKLETVWPKVASSMVAS